jgi:hypothetical protein
MIEVNKKIRTGTPEEIKQIAELRGLDPEDILLAQEAGYIRFAEFAKKSAWLMRSLDDSVHEYRRLDGQSWEAFNQLPERKVHSRGTKKYPIGLNEVGKKEYVAILEGSTDLLAFYHFARIEEKLDQVAPVAILGASNGLPIETNGILADKNVVIYADLDKAGLKAAIDWYRQIERYAKRVDLFNVQKPLLNANLHADAKGVKDLSDLARIDHLLYGENHKLEVFPW